MMCIFFICSFYQSRVLRQKCSPTATEVAVVVNNTGRQIQKMSGPTDVIQSRWVFWHIKRHRQTENHRDEPETTHRVQSQRWTDDVAQEMMVMIQKDSSIIHCMVKCLDGSDNNTQGQQQHLVSKNRQTTKCGHNRDCQPPSIYKRTVILQSLHRWDYFFLFYLLFSSLFIYLFIHSFINSFFQLFIYSF